MSEDHDYSNRFTESRESYEENRNHRIRVWSKFERYCSEAPSYRPETFQNLKDLMTSRFKYVGAVAHYVTGAQELLPQKPLAEFALFMDLAESTQFVLGTQEKMIDGHEVLKDIFLKLPQFKREVGQIRYFLKKQLDNLFGDGTSWGELKFSVTTFRRLYARIQYSLGVQEAADSGMENAEPEQLKLLFSIFIVAIMASIVRQHDVVLSRTIPNFEEVETFHELLEALVAMPAFHTFSLFFIAGFWILVRYRQQGGYITQSTSRRVPAGQDAMDEIAYDRRMKKPMTFHFKLGNAVDISQEWNTLAVELLQQGLFEAAELSVTNENFQRAPVEVREEPLAKRTTEAKQPRAEKLVPTTPEVETAPSIVKIEPSSSVEPFIRRPMPITRNFEDFGIEKPIFIVQDELIAGLKAEMIRRRQPGYEPDYEGVAKLFNKQYTEAHRLERTARLSKRQELNNAEQKKARKEFERLYKTNEYQKELLEQYAEDDKKHAEQNPISEDNADRNADGSAPGPSSSSQLS